MLACSSAGGGLRIAVVGNEELVTAEAGRRVALSSGGKVVAVRAGRPRATTSTSAAVAPDVVLLTGGTDGGNPELILRAARGLTDSGWRGPVVVAGNVDARDEVSAILGDLPHVSPTTSSRGSACSRPASARAAIREVFLSHVIGGKHLSKRSQTSRRWSGAPRRTSCSPASSCSPRADRRGRGRRRRRRHHRRPLGRRARPRDTPGWPATSSRPPRSPAPSRATSACAGPRSRPSRRRACPDLAEAARTTARRPRASCPTTDREHDEDEAIARAAVALALRRHAGRSKVVVSPEGRVVERTGVDLREVGLVVGSGGVLRHGRDGVADRVLGPSVGQRTATGSSPSGPGSSSTPTTSWPPPGCWPPTTPTRRTGW